LEADASEEKAEPEPEQSEGALNRMAEIEQSLPGNAALFREIYEWATPPVVLTITEFPTCGRAAIR
jgi:hypothetical protein